LGAEKALFRALKTKGNTPKVPPFPSLSRPFSHTSFSMVFCIILLSLAAPNPNIRAASHDSSQTNVQ